MSPEPRGGRRAPTPAAGAVEPIASVLPAVLAQARERHGALAAVRERWPALVGRELSAHTRPVSLRRGRLVVVADRPGDAFVLSYRREAVIGGLRRATRGTVEELVIRPGGDAHGVCD